MVVPGPPIDLWKHGVTCTHELLPRQVRQSGRIVAARRNAEQEAWPALGLGSAADDLAEAGGQLRDWYRQVRAIPVVIALAILRFRVNDITVEPGRDQGLCDVVRLVDRVTAALVLYDGRPAPSIDFHTGCLESRHACCEPVAGRAYDDRFRAHRLGMTKNPVLVRLIVEVFGPQGFIRKNRHGCLPITAVIAFSRRRKPRCKPTRCLP